MKNRHHILTALLVPILLVCLLVNMTSITAYATEATETPDAAETVAIKTDNTLYQIEFSLNFADNADTETEPSIEQYKQNQFRIYNAENDEYLIAKYNEDIHAYIFDNKVTIDKTKATVFTVGISDEQPNKVLILNIPTGTYYMEQIGVTATYSALPDPVEINLNSENPTVSGYSVELANHNLMTFNITLILEEDVKVITDLQNGETQPEETPTSVNPILIVLIIIAIILLVLTIYPMFNSSDAETNKKGTHHGKKKK